MLVEADDAFPPAVSGMWAYGEHGRVSLLLNTQKELETGHDSLQRFSQQHLALLPLPANGPVGDAQGLGNLGLGEAAEIAQLDDLGQPRIESRRDRRALREPRGSLPPFRPCSSASPVVSVTCGAPPPRRSAVRRRAKSTMTERMTRPAQRRKCTRSSMFSAPARRKAKIRLVDERARVEQRTASAGHEPQPCQPAQIGVGRGEQAVGRVGIALLGAMNQIGQVEAIVHDGWSLARYAGS